MAEYASVEDVDNSWDNTHDEQNNSVSEIRQEDLQDSINKWVKQIKELKKQQEKLNLCDPGYLSKSTKLQNEIDYLQKKIDQAVKKRDGK